MATTTIKITLSNSAGELDSTVVPVVNDEQGITEGVIAWLAENQIILAPGDTIRVADTTS